MDISLRPVGEWTVEDRSWLGSRDGTEFTESITLDISSFTEATHYPNGFIPSGTVLSKLSSSLYGPYAPASAEVQAVTITGAPDGGTFTLTFSGQTTTAIAYNATAAAVQAALVALSNIAAGDVTVTGGPGPATPWAVTFAGAYIGTNVAQMTATSSLTGGTTPAVAVTTTTAGGTASATTAVGFLFNSTLVPANRTTDVGAPLLWRGVIKTVNLPAGSGLDPTAQTQLAAKFRFK
jgi:hypothetical protein